MASRRPRKSSPPKASSKPPRPKKPNRRSGGKSSQPDQLFLYGLHTVRAALDNPERKKQRLYATPNALERLGSLPDDLQTENCDATSLSAMVGRDAVHQGVVLECSALTQLDASELFHLADARFVLVLDQITDPHNVGAILRSAVAMNVDAVLVTSRQSAAETGALAKSASGALDCIRLISVRNLSKALEELNDMGIFTVGLDSEGPTVLEHVVDQQRGQPMALVLGSEGRGLRQQTRETCKALARLDMPGPIKSLNVSNAAALSLYLVSKALSK